MDASICLTHCQQNHQYVRILSIFDRSGPSSRPQFAPGCGFPAILWPPCHLGLIDSIVWECLQHVPATYCLVVAHPSCPEQRDINKLLFQDVNVVETNDILMM